MFDFEPFDMDSEGDVDGIDFLGFDYLMRYVFAPDGSEDRCDELRANTADDDVSTLDYAPTDNEKKAVWEHEGW